MFRMHGARQDIQPSRDWLILFFATIGVFVGSVVWNVFFFLDTVSVKEDVVETTESGAVDTSAVERLRALFYARETERARYGGEYQFIDPSR